MEKFDICIVGGGFTGLGVGIESLKQGLTSVIVEKEKELGSKASKNSLQIIHGGFRYLQNLDLPRVIESIKAQSDLRNAYPEFTEILPCILPLEPLPSLKSKSPLSCASFFYDTLYSLYGNLSHRRTYTISASESSRYTPFNGYAPHGILLWHDVLMTNQEGLINSLRDEFILLGGDLIYGDYHPLLRNITCFCSGIEDESSPQRDWVLGCNIRIPTKLAFKVGTAIKSNARYFFAIPEGDTTHIGTWYFNRSRKTSYDEYAPSDSEIDFIVGDLHTTIPEMDITKSDIKEITWGMLPAMGDSLPLDHPYTHQSENELHCVTTKLTTFQTQAKKIVRQLKEMHEK